MVAPDHDRGLEHAVAHHAVEAQAEPMPLAVAEPADARREALEAHVLLRERDPALEPGVVRELLERRPIGGEDVLRVARERRPAERALAGAEQRADVLRDEAGIRERLLVR